MKGTIFMGILFGLLGSIITLILIPVIISSADVVQWSSVEGAVDYLTAKGYVVEGTTGIPANMVPYADVGGDQMTYNVGFYFTPGTTTLTVPHIAAPTGRGATYVIAASDAPAHVKAQADYVCDGTADNVEIQAALDALPVSGGWVQLTDGTYYIANSLQITSYDKLIGKGTVSTRLILSADVDMIYVGTGAASASLVQISSLSLEGAARAYSNTSDAIYFRSAGAAGNYNNQFLISDIRIVEFKGAALRIDYTQDSVFRDISIGDCGDTGVSTVKLTGNVTIQAACNIFYGLRIDGGSIGVELNNYARMNRFVACKWDADAVVVPIAGFYIYGAENIIDGLIAYTYTLADVIHIEESGGLHATNNKIVNSTITGGTTADGCNGINNNQNTYPLYVSGNTIYGFARGIRGTSANSLYSDNILDANARDIEFGTGQTFIINNVFTETNKSNIFIGTQGATQIYGNKGYIASGEVRTASGSLTGGAANAILFSWHNPEAQDIFIKKVVINITTADADAANIDVGIADDATYTNGGTEFFNDLKGETIQVNDSLVTTEHTQTVWVLCQDSASATDGWVVAKILDNDGTSIVGSWYIEYVGK